MEPYELGVYRVGDTISKLALQCDGCMTDFISGNLCIHTLIYKPTPQMQSDANVDMHGLRLGVFARHNMMALAVKPGKLPWHDSYFTPHLSADENLPANIPFDADFGLTAFHFLIDSCDGRILQIKPFSLSAHFSNYLINCIYTLKEEEFDAEEYAATISYIQQRYSAHELGTSLKQDYFRLNPYKNNP